MGLFLPMVSHGASGRDECSVDRVEQRLVSPTSVTIAWSYQCPEEKLKQFKFYAWHLEYSACNDKTKPRQAGANLSGDPSKRFEGPTGEGGGGGVRRGQVRRRRGEGIPAAKGADTIFSDGGG